MAKAVPDIEQAGYVWLFAMSGCFLIRLLLDPLMVRRPLLEPNLSVGGMTFIGTSLLIFLMANVINSKLTADDLAGASKPAGEPAGIVGSPRTRAWPSTGRAIRCCTCCR